MCARWLGGELHVEVCVLGHSAVDLLERWSFDIRSSTMSHPAMNCMSADRADCVRGVGEGGVTRACRGADVRGGELLACMSLLLLRLSSQCSRNESFGVLLWVWEEESPNNMGYLCASHFESYRMVVLAG